MRKTPKKRPTPPLSEVWLRRQAERYLMRYQASEKRIRQMLWRRVRRAQSFHGGEDSDAQTMINAVIESLEKDGAINDAAYANGWVQTLIRRGSSAKAIRYKLMEKGVAGHHIDSAMQQAQASTDDWEVEAAATYAKKRRLGPYRIPPDTSWKQQQKDLASMARAGFSFDLAKRTLAAAKD